MSYQDLFGDMGSAPFTKEDERDLRNGGMLMDNVLRLAMHYLAPAMPKPPNCVVFDPGFLNHFEGLEVDEVDEAEKVNYRTLFAESALPRYKRRLNRHLLMPYLFYNGRPDKGHWVLVVVVPDRNSWTILDSMNTVYRNQNQMGRITSIVHELHRTWWPGSGLDGEADWNFVETTCTDQGSTLDCGIHTVENMFNLMRGFNPSTSVVNGPAKRREYLDFMTGLQNRRQDAAGDDQNQHMEVPGPPRRPSSLKTLIIHPRASSPSSESPLDGKDLGVPSVRDAFWKACTPALRLPPPRTPTEVAASTAAPLVLARASTAPVLSTTPKPPPFGFERGIRQNFPAKLGSNEGFQWRKPISPTAQRVLTRALTAPVQAQVPNPPAQTVLPTFQSASEQGPQLESKAPGRAQAPSPSVHTASSTSTSDAGDDPQWGSDTPVQAQAQAPSPSAQTASSSFQFATRQGLQFQSKTPGRGQAPSPSVHTVSSTSPSDAGDDPQLWSDMPGQTQAQAQAPNTFAQTASSSFQSATGQGPQFGSNNTGQAQAPNYSAQTAPPLFTWIPFSNPINLGTNTPIWQQPPTAPPPQTVPTQQNPFKLVAPWPLPGQSFNTRSTTYLTEETPVSRYVAHAWAYLEANGMGLSSQAPTGVNFGNNVNPQPGFQAPANTEDPNSAAPAVPGNAERLSSRRLFRR